MLEQRFIPLLDSASKACKDAILKLDPKSVSFPVEFALLQGQYTGLERARYFLKQCIQDNSLGGDEL